jgi:hypothetical protein
VLRYPVSFPRSEELTHFARVEAVSRQTRSTAYPAGHLFCLCLEFTGRFYTSNGENHIQASSSVVSPALPFFLTICTRLSAREHRRAPVSMFCELILHAFGSSLFYITARETWTYLSVMYSRHFKLNTDFGTIPKSNLTIRPQYSKVLLHCKFFRV